MKSLSSIIGWLLLLAVLAVPSFLFYNWWTKNKAQAAAEMGTSGVQHNIFPQQDKAAVQPAPASQPAAPSAAAQQAPAVQPAAQPSAQTVQSAPKPAAPVQPAPSQPSPSQPAAAAVSTAAPHAVAVSTQTKPLSSFEPKGQRDPMLSPDDYRRIKETEDAQREAEMARQYAEAHRPKAPSIEDKVSLQGIVGNAAIINGDMYYVGQSVKGIKLLKLGANYVVMEYKGKTFKKMMK